MAREDRDVVLRRLLFAGRRRGALVLALTHTGAVSEDIMKRCPHEAIPLFDKPAKGDERAAILHFVSGYAGRGWVVCRRCGETGYWGGYGMKRRVRWGYGDESLLKTAEQHNRLMRGETVEASAL